MPDNAPSCVSCNSERLKRLFSAPVFDTGVNGSTSCYDVARCENCNLVQTIGVSDTELDLSYNNDYYGSGHSKFIPAVERMIALLARLNARRLLKQWRWHGKSPIPEILDIGCGRGVLVKEFNRMGCNVVGIERPGFPANDSSPDLIEVGSLADARYDGRRFDIVVLWHVLEHLRDPGDVLSQITGHMHSDGMLVVTVPNFSSLQRRLFGRYWFHLDLPRHLLHLDPDWLCDALRRHGFEVGRVRSFDPLQNIYGFIQSTMNALAPRHINELYYFLKRPRSIRGWRALRFLGWLIIAALLLPIALIELVAGLLFSRSSTLEVSARFRCLNG